MWMENLEDSLDQWFTCLWKFCLGDCVLTLCYTNAEKQTLLSV